MAVLAVKDSGVCRLRPASRYMTPSHGEVEFPVSIPVCQHHAAGGLKGLVEVSELVGPQHGAEWLRGVAAGRGLVPCSQHDAVAIDGGGNARHRMGLPRLEAEVGPRLETSRMVVPEDHPFSSSGQEQVVESVGVDVEESDPGALGGQSTGEQGLALQILGGRLG